MKLLKVCVFAVLAITTVYAVDYDEIINKVNREHTTWKAGKNFNDDVPRAFLLQLAGVRPDFNEREQMVLVKLKPDFDVGAVKIPTYFDARDAWPQCSSIKRIIDQSACGSCWAVSVASVLTDRMCIFGNTQVNISAEDLLSCCTSCGHGCNGGYPQKAFKYFEDEGIVSGGFYGSNKGCKPYSIPPCQHKPCDLAETPKCSKKCINGYPKSYKNDKYEGRVAYQIESDEKEIMGEIFRNGPVEAAFTVYEDFYYFKSGIYQHVTGKQLGGHAVKIIGWGEEDGVKYWLIANSWGKKWGDESGFFKMIRGQNNCGIEEQINAALPIY